MSEKLNISPKAWELLNNLTATIHGHAEMHDPADYAEKARAEDALLDYIVELENGLIKAGKQEGLYLEGLFRLRKQTHWTSVDDELPEEGQEVIMLNRNGLDVSLFYFPHISQEPFDSRYSHWMPKPEVEK